MSAYRVHMHGTILEQIPISVICNITVESEINGGYSFLCWNIVYKFFNEFGGIA